MNIRSELAARKIVVTGAGSGMGRAIVELFAAEDAVVAAIDVDEGGLASLGGSSVTPIVADVASVDAVDAAIRRAAAAMGGIDGVVNAAGILRVAALADTDVELWMRIQNVNLLGPYLVCRAALPMLQAAERATIVNIASLAGMIGVPGMSAYGASKGGLIGLTKVLAAELGPTIRANAICPGIIDTPMTQALWAGHREASDAATGQLALRRAGTADEVAQTALFLTSTRSSFTTGTVTTVDGGSTWH